MRSLTIEEIIGGLVMYYDSAGFAEIDKRELTLKTEDEIRELYRITFRENNEEES